MSEPGGIKSRLVNSLQACAQRIFGSPLEEKSPVIMWPWLYAIFVNLFRLCFVLWGHWKVTGKENLPEGGYIVAANHLSYVDPPLVGSAMKRYGYFMAKAELFDVPVFGKIIPRLGAFPVKRGSVDRAAFKRTLDLLAAGEVVAIFPEGTRGEPGEMAPASAGFGWIAYKARVPVVPMGLVNSADLLPRHARWLRSSRVRVHIGAPMNFDDLFALPDSKQAILEITTRTMAAIRELANETGSPV